MLDAELHPEPIVVASCADRGEAEVTKAHLVSNVIDAEIVDEVEGGTVPVDGESRLLVRKRSPMSMKSVRRSSMEAARRSPWFQHRSWTRHIAVLSVAAMASAFGVIATDQGLVRAAAPIAAVPLGLVQTFGVLTPAAVGNAAPEPVTVIRGDVGGGGAITGFPPGIITGTTYTAAAVNPMMADLQIAYANAAGRPAGTPLPAVLSGSFAPGVHSTIAATGTAAGGTFTIDGQGNPDAVFIFQVGGALALGANTTMTLINGAQAKNVFWQVAGAGSLGAANVFVGTLMAGTAVASGAGSTVSGRLTSLTGAVTMSSTQLYSAPPSVSIDGGAVANTISSTPLITGLTSARSPMTVIVAIDGVDQTPVVTPSATGVWSYQASLLVNGPHTVVARSVDGAGNVGSYTQVLTVDTTPPVVTINGGGVATTNDLTPTIRGVTDIAAGQVVTLTFTRPGPPVTLTRTALVQADQSWNVSPNGLTAGVWTIVARVVDPAGNASTGTQTLTIDTTAPAAALTSNPLTNDPTPTITGTAEVGATVAVSIDGLALGNLTQGATWSATATVALGHGLHNVSVTATDAVGNATLLTQTLDVDLVLPVISINPGATNSTNDSTPTIAGTTDVAVGVTVRVAIDGGAPLTALVQADGWNVTPSVALSAGQHTIAANVVDPAGNVGTATQTLTIDITDPTVIIDGGPSRTTADATPTIAGSSPDVPVGSNVTVQVAGQTLPTSIAAGGTYSVTAATIDPNGTYFVLVTVIDAAGNDGQANQSLTINAIAPTVTYTNGPTATTNDTTPLISGTTNAPVGSTVVVSVDSQSLRATVQPGGSWNVTAAALATGPVTVVTSITDPNGNVGTAIQTLTVDSTAPTSITITGGASISTNDDTPTISGTTGAADGRIITVTVASQTLTVPASAGTWAVTAARIADGTYAATAAVSAVGGNPGSATQSLTIDTVAPVVVIGSGDGTVQTTDPTPNIAGSGATPGSTVTVTVAGQTMTTTVAPDGTWSVTPPNPLPAGDNPVTVTITDPAGNIGTGTQTITVVLVATTVAITGGAIAVTNDSTPTISGTTNAANGRVLTVTVSTQTRTTSVAGGTWAVDVANLADGTYSVTASLSVSDGTPAASAQSLTVTTTVTPPTPAPAPGPGPAPAATSSFEPLTPTRVLDTRGGAKVGNAAGTATPLTLSLFGKGGLPTGGIGAVALNVTVVAGENPTIGGGYVTVYPCGTRPDASNLNFTTGQTIPNSVIAPLSTSGTACFYVYGTAHLLADVSGYFPAGAGFTSLNPARIMNTRGGAKVGNAAGTGTPYVLQATGRGGVPVSGVGAVALNVTVTQTESPTIGGGYVTVYPCGTRPDASNLNFVTGQTIPNSVIAPVSASGEVCFYVYGTAHLLADVSGYFPAGSGFTSLSPSRVLNTRDGAKVGNAAGTGAPYVLKVLGRGGVPATGVGAVALNVTVTQTENPTLGGGYVTVYPCGTRPDASNLNFVAGETIANSVIAPVSAQGEVCFYVYGTTHLLADASGYLAD